MSLSITLISRGSVPFHENINFSSHTGFRVFDDFRFLNLSTHTYNTIRIAPPIMSDLTRFVAPIKWTFNIPMARLIPTKTLNYLSSWIVLLSGYLDDEDDDEDDGEKKDAR